MFRRAVTALSLLALLLIGTTPRTAQAVPVVPANFVVENAFPGVGFVVPTKVAWLPDGRALVAEKRGRVWAVQNGVKAATPMLAIDAQVLDANDRGLLGLTVDPNYFVNHYIYVMYTVDPDSDNVETNTDAYSRLCRYTVNFTDSASVIASSRAILFGDTWTNGIVSASPSHTIGDLNWGADGSLMVSNGDGADFNQMDQGGLEPGSFGAGKTDPSQDIGAFRAQSLSSLNGKILRLNPATGQGYASNPWYDGNLSSIRSRIWCYGLRNPFRFTVRPGTGVTNPATGNPGTLFVGDVGWNTWEEQNITTTGGKNFGWPCYEGPSGQSSYQAGNPAHNGCSTLGTISDDPVFQTAPTLTYNHSSSVSSVPNFTGLWGNTAIGGTFYRGANYPGAYRQQYFFGDYGQSWVRVMTVDANSNMLSVADFGTAMDSPVNFSTDPVSGDVFYVSITTGQVRRIRYTGVTGNANPIAVAVASPDFGASPLTVSFSSSGTYDPDADPITYGWTFGDGSVGSTDPNPVHQYATPGTYHPILSVYDNKGGIGRDTLVVTVTGNSAFPSAAVLDNFNRANGGIGANWTVDKAGLNVSGNALTQSASDNVAVWNSNLFGANQEAYFTFTNVNISAPEHDLMLKVQGFTWDTGEIEVRYDGASQAVVVSTYAPVSGWQQRGTPMPVTFAAGDRFGARALADGTIQVFRNSGMLGSVYAPDWAFSAQGGHVGMTLVGLGSTIIDDFGGGDINFNSNTPPVCKVTSPVNKAFFVTGQVLPLTGTASDAQDAANKLKYHWDVELHHNTHIHFVLAFDSVSTSYIGVNHDDGTGVFDRIRLTVTDTGGLSAKDSVDIYPEIDLSPTPVTFLPAAPTTVDSITYSFRLRNYGRMPANISHWAILTSAGVLAQGDTLVAALDSVTISAKVPPSLLRASYALRVVADTTLKVTETNEANNSAMSAITILPSPVNHPPVAAASGTPVSGSAPLFVNFTSAASTDPDGDPLTSAWTFGDGGTATGTTTTHSYTAPGSYTATVTVSDGRGGTASANVAISVSTLPGTFPTAAVLDNFNRSNGVLGANWLNAGSIRVASNLASPGTSASNAVWNGGPFGPYQEAFMTLTTLSSTSTDQDLMLKIQGTTFDTGHIRVRYNSSTKQVIVQTYTTAQGYVTRGAPITVTMVNGDKLGARATPDGTVEVWRNGVKLGTVSAVGWPFIANGGRIGMAFVGASTARADDFGGGTMANSPDSPPVAAASASPSTGVAPFTTTLSSAGSSDPDNDPLTFTWAFGDGTTGAGASVSHTYAAVGSYTATVTANDGRGGTASASVVIAVTNTPPPFPTTPVVDNFNRANGALGGSWVGATTGMTIASNAMVQGSQDVTMVWNGAVFGASQEAYVTFVALNNAAPEHDFMMCVQGLSWDTGHIEVRYEGPTSSVFITSYSGAQGWISRGTVNVAYAAGDRFGVRVRADNTVEVYRNATLMGTASVAGWTYAGLGGHVGMTLTGTTGTIIDDFGAGNSAVAAQQANLKPAQGDTHALPATLALSGAWPNPSAGRVQFTLAMPHDARVGFAVYDLEGRQVFSDGDRAYAAGTHTLAWSGATATGARAPVGVYLARVMVGEQVLTRRVALLR